MMIRARLSVLACLTVLMSIALGPAAAWADFGKRYALVIGNSAYGHAEPLPNASHDAAQIAQTLSELHFEVFAGFNLSRHGFQRLINDFGQQVVTAEADTVLIYYAGHGFELDGINRLVPVDAELRDRSEIETETFALDAIISSVQSPERQTIVFLDACRDNPLPESLRKAYSSQGLAQVRTGTNTFVAFATQPGNVSYEGSGSNSPFTEALLTNIAKPNLSLSDMMIAVRSDVSSRTVDRQVPWDQSSLRSQFYFNPRDVRIAANDVGSTAPSGDRQGSGIDQARGASQAYDRPEASGDDIERPGILIGSTGSDASAAAAPEAQIQQPAAEQQVAIATPSEPPLAPEVEADDLIKPLQAKLRSIGCYRGAIDGDWGPMSKAAVKQYFQKKGQPLPTLDPTGELLETVEQESGTVCEPPKAKVVAKKQKQKQAKKAAPAKRAAAKSPPRYEQPYHEPAGPPISPTINLWHGGIGIGFGF